jgi:hypothetical protein
MYYKEMLEGERSNKTMKSKVGFVLDIRIFLSN